MKPRPVAALLDHEATDDERRIMALIEHEPVVALARAGYYKPILLRPKEEEAQDKQYDQQFRDLFFGKARELGLYD